MKLFLRSILGFYNFIVAFTYKILFYNKINNFVGVKEILFFKVGSMGDNIITLPAISSLKDTHPDINITILTNSGRESLVSIESLIDKTYVKEFINYTGKSKVQLLNSIKNKKYDLVIDLTQPSSLLRTLRNMLVFRLLGIKKGIGWNISELPYFRKKQDDYNMVGSELEKYLSYLEKNGVKTEKKFILGMGLDEKKKVDLLIEKYKLKNKKIIGFVIGSNRITNRWPIESFNNVIQYVKNGGFVPVVIGGEHDKGLVEKITESVISFCGELTPLESAELLKRCDLVISNDTGPMHLSYAVNTRVISIFSSRDFKGKWYPPKELGYAVRDNNIDCRLCYKETCSHLSCLKKTTEDDVIKIIKEEINYEV